MAMTIIAISTTPTSLPTTPPAIAPVVPSDLSSANLKGHQKEYLNFQKHYSLIKIPAVTSFGPSGPGEGRIVAVHEWVRFL